MPCLHASFIFSIILVILRVGILELVESTCCCHASHPPAQAARDRLMRACLPLQQRGAAATPALLDALALLHSYLLVRGLVRQGEHLEAARLLLRVAERVEAAFHRRDVVPILTSTVVECHRAGLHGPAQVRQSDVCVLMVWLIAHQPSLRTLCVYGPCCSAGRRC